MNELQLIFKKNHWLIVPALLATGSMCLGIWLIGLPVETGLPALAAPFFIIGLFHVLLEEFGVHWIGSFFIVWTATFCSWILIYLFSRLMYRIFAPIKVKQGS